MNYKFIFPVAALIVLLTIYGSTGNHRAENTGYQAALRLIGHRLLLSTGDTTSRVMPIKQVSGKKYQVRFEKPLSLEPDSLFRIISQTTKQSRLPEAYTADVIDCATNEVVYGFVMSGVDSNVIVPCLGRTLPKGCYYIAFDFTAAWPAGSKTSYLWAASILLVMLLAFLGYSYARRKKSHTVPEEETTPAHKGTIPIGGFRFNVPQRYLEMDGERTELTDKETKLLSIFAAAPNKIIDREQLQKEVWENEGVIVTRSLDVFVSRLRKKLDKDPNLKLVNVHGKGYKLEELAS